MALSQDGQNKVNGVVTAINNKIDSSISSHDANESAHEDLFSEQDTSFELKLSNILDDLADEIRKE